MRGIRNYILVLFTLLFALLVVSVEFGLAMLQVFFFGAIFSLIYRRLIKEKIYFNTTFSHAQIEKGEKVKVRIKVMNQSFFPTSFIDIHLLTPPECKAKEEYILRVALASRQMQTLEVDYEGFIRGSAKIGIEKVVLRSFFGLRKSLIMDEIKAQSYQSKIIITPCIFHIDITSELFISTNEQDGAGEDEEHSKVSLFGGQPGYEFRDYRPGDSLSRVNWKLSAKKDALMVRENITYTSNNKVLLLNPYTYQDLLIQERLLEGILSVSYGLVSNEVPVQMILFEEGKWNVYELESCPQVERLKVKLAEYRFQVSRTTEASPKEISKCLSGIKAQNLNIILFTSQTQDAFTLMLENHLDVSAQIQKLWISKQQSSSDPIKDNNLWRMNENNQIVRI